MVRNSLSRSMIAGSVFVMAAVAALVAVFVNFSAEAKQPVTAPHETSGDVPDKGKVFDNWGVACEKQPDGKTEKCFAQQVQSTKEGGQRVLTIAIGHFGPKDAPAMVVVLPLGINLQTGAAFKIDEQAQLPLQLQQCTTAGCQSMTPLSEPQLKSLVDGKTMVVGVMPWGKPETTSIAVPLKGLAEALAASR